MNDSFFKDRHSLSLAHNPLGMFYLPNVDNDAIMKVIRRGQIYDEVIVNKCLELTKPNTEFIDIGANVGQMSIALSKVCSHVYAVEADPYLTYVLHKNVALNNSWNCTVISAAAWDNEGELLPYPDPDLVRFGSLGSYGITPESTTNRTIHSMKIDSLGLQNVSCIKIDAQGSDLRAMIGAIDTINRCKPSIIFEYESIFDSDFSTGFHDYLQFIHDIEYEIFEEVSQNNFLIIPKSATV